jgi:polyhydroxyalkanoate synthesis repressor PhaR
MLVLANYILEDAMHLIKKYSNRKLYDSTDKKYIKINEITDLIQSGEEVTIIDNKTGEDITSEIVSQQVGENVSSHLRNVPQKLLVQFMRKGKNGLVDFTQNYVTFLQSTLFTLSGEKSRAGMSDQNDETLMQNIEVLNDIIDSRVADALKNKGSASQKKVADMEKTIADLSSRLESYDRIFAKFVEKAAGKD